MLIRNKNILNKLVSTCYPVKNIFSHTHFLYLKERILLSCSESLYSYISALYIFCDELLLFIGDIWIELLLFIIFCIGGGDNRFGFVGWHVGWLSIIVCDVETCVFIFILFDFKYVYIRGFL